MYEKILLEKAYAYDDCGLRNENKNKKSDILSQVSLSRAVNNCEINVLSLIKDGIKAVVDLYTDFTLPSFTELAEMFDTLQGVLENLTTDFIKMWGRLAENAPQIVESMMCEVLKDKGPMLAAAMLMPGGIRKLPFEVVKILEYIRKSVMSPHIMKLMENSAALLPLDRFTPVLTKLTHVVPDKMKKPIFRDENADSHFNKHKNEFPEMNSVEDYKKRIAEFSEQSNYKIIHYCPTSGRCGKLNVETGEYLVVENGEFVTFFKIDGASQEERFARYVRLQQNQNQFVH